MLSAKLKFGSDRRHSVKGGRRTFDFAGPARSASVIFGGAARRILVSPDNRPAADEIPAARRRPARNFLTGRPSGPALSHKRKQTVRQYRSLTGRPLGPAPSQERKPVVDHKGRKQLVKELTRIGLCAMLLAAASARAASPAPEQTVEGALESLYNFDFPAAHASLNSYIQAHPGEALPYAFRGAAYLFYELDRLGALESEFLIDDDRLVEKTRPRPDANVRKQFLGAVYDAQTRAETALKANPNDRDALFALCVVSAISTDYMALVEKRQIGSLAPAKKANAYAQRLLKLDPKFYDAYLTAGFSEYLLGSLPFFIRWFVHFDNVDGDKRRAIENLQLVAREGRYFRPLAKVFLGIIDLREKKPREARNLLAELARDYPGNPLYRKELDKLDRRLAVPSD
jgi:tetratricopeptide (TPR) repeat protein